MSKKDFLVALDIGTSKLCCAIGQLIEEPHTLNSQMHIVAVEQAPSIGLKRGSIANMDATVESISKVVEQSELKAGVQISMVYANSVSSSQNTIECIQRSGLKVAQICSQSIASSEAVLSQEEKKQGVILVDIGAGTSDIIIFKEGLVFHTEVIPLGGNHITNDIAVVLRTPQNEAEKIKINYGCAMSSMIHQDETIQVPGIGGRKSRILSKKFLSEIIEPRIEEIFFLIHQAVFRSGYEQSTSAGLVITGGSSLLNGISEVAKNIFDVPVRIGSIQNVSGLGEKFHSPQFAAVLGLLKYGSRNKPQTDFLIQEKNIYDKVRGSMRTWIKDLF